MVEVRVCRVADFFAHPDSAGLIAEYADECANAQLPAPNPHRAMYEALEQAGILRLLTANSGERMLGFASVIVNDNPHYSVKLAGTESLFVSKEHRGQSIGESLLAVVEQIAQELGAVGFYVSAPLGGMLEKIAPSWGYRHTNQVFFRNLP